MPLGGLQVQAEAALIAIHITKSRLTLGACRYPRARLGAERRRGLDLEDVCPHIRQDHGTKASWRDACKLQDGGACQCSSQVSHTQQQGRRVGNLSDNVPEVNERIFHAALELEQKLSGGIEELLEEQVAIFKPKFAELVSNGGSACLVEAATRNDVDIVLNAVVGAAGLDASPAGSTSPVERSTTNTASTAVR